MSREPSTCDIERAVRELTRRLGSPRVHVRVGTNYGSRYVTLEYTAADLRDRYRERAEAALADSGARVLTPVSDCTVLVCFERSVKAVYSPCQMVVSWLATGVLLACGAFLWYTQDSLHAVPALVGRWAGP